MLRRWLAIAYSCAVILAVFHLVVSEPGPAPPSISIPPTYPPIVYVGSTRASYYSIPEHGRRAACGQIYNMYDISVAHTTLPCGTILIVKNSLNERWLRVVVTDRMPSVWESQKRKLDFSLGAAEALDFVRHGVIPVEVYREVSSW